MIPPKLPDLKLADGDLFGAALLLPAFASDHSIWTVVIHKHGLLTQTVVLSQPPNYDKQVAVLRQHVPRDRIETLKRIVQEENLCTFGTFPELCITGPGQTRLMIGLHGKAIVIDAYGPHVVAALGETDADRAKAKRYCKLWDAIVELTPFAPYVD